MILCLPVAGFSGEALLALLHRLELHAVPFSIASEELGRCQGTGGVHVTATARFDELRPSELGGLIVLDGDDGRLRDNETLLELVRGADRERVLVAGVGEGALVLLAAGVLHARPVAVDEESADRVRALGGVPMIEPLVVSDHLVTTTESGAAALGDAIHDLRGPATAAPEPAV